MPICTFFLYINVLILCTTVHPQRWTRRCLWRGMRFSRGWWLSEQGSTLPSSCGGCCRWWAGGRGRAFAVLVQRSKSYEKLWRVMSCEVYVKELWRQSFLDPLFVNGLLYSDESLQKKVLFFASSSSLFFLSCSFDTRVGFSDGSQWFRWYIYINREDALSLYCLFRVCRAAYVEQTLLVELYIYLPIYFFLY